jgi:hypothetical protein
MEDLKNKEIFKVMWLPKESRILLNVKNEEFVTLNSSIYERLSIYIDIPRWIILYEKKYSDWLNNDENSIYNINDNLNKKMVDALRQLNESYIDKRIFYWFDIDRTNNPNFDWEYCPLSEKKLIFLGYDYPKINSLISPDFPLIFPSN